jgi:hypothetical protein
MAAEAVVGTVDVEAPVEDMGFAVRDILPGGKVRIKSLHEEDSFTNES